MKEKPLIPTLREKKRYVVYEVLSDAEVKFDTRKISDSIRVAMKGYVGDLGLSKAGLLFFDKKFNTSTNRGFVRVSHSSVDEFKASLNFITSIEGKNVIIKSVITSGLIARAEVALKSQELNTVKQTKTK